MAVRPRLEQKLDAPLDPILRLSEPSKSSKLKMDSHGVRLEVGPRVSRRKF